MEDGRTNHLQCSNLLSAKFNFILFHFPDGAQLLCPGQEMVLCFWMLLKPWWVFLNSGAPSALEQVEPLGLYSQQPLCLDYTCPTSPACVVTRACKKSFSLEEEMREQELFTSLWHTQLGHFGNSLGGSSVSWLLLKIHFIQLWPLRASCWEITDLHPLLKMSWLGGWTLCLQRKDDVWDGCSLMERGSATPQGDDLIFLPPEK